MSGLIGARTIGSIERRHLRDVWKDKPRGSEGISGSISSAGCFNRARFPRKRRIKGRHAAQLILVFASKFFHSLFGLYLSATLDNKVGARPELVEGTSAEGVALASRECSIRAYSFRATRKVAAALGRARPLSVKSLAKPAARYSCRNRDNSRLA